MNRLSVVALLALAALAVSAASALAEPPDAKNPAGHVRGVVPPRKDAARKAPGSQNLQYHGGPVMHQNAAYAIYWDPTGAGFDSTYRTVMNRFFTDVAADHGSANVYWADTQYYDGAGSIADNSTFAGSSDDTTPFPASGCRDSYTAICLTDAQLQGEIRSVATRNNIPLDGKTLFFIFTPKNVGSCYGSSCAYSNFCAYHSQDSTGNLIYANQPYAAFVRSACDSGQHPNAGDADATINVVSHEHNEAITDPLGTAWFDQRGYENGDKCAWNFGTATGPSGAQYNQTINSNHYYLQQEWSNKTGRCVLGGL